jgi:hypothetical protein
MFRTEVVEKIKTYILYSVTFVFSPNRTVYAKMWKNSAERGRSNVNMARTQCMLDTEDYKYTHSGCVILIALSLQQWLRERTSMLRYTCIACLVTLYILRDIMSLNI